MDNWILWLILAHVIVTIAVVAIVLRRHFTMSAMQLPQDAVLADLAQIGPLANFAKERHERIADYVRANWSGMPDQLPGVLTSLLDQLEREARAQGHTFSRELLKTVVATSLRSHRLAKANEIGEALELAA